MVIVRNLIFPGIVTFRVGEVCIILFENAPSNSQAYCTSWPQQYLLYGLDQGTSLKCRAPKASTVGRFGKQVSESA